MNNVKINWEKVGLFALVVFVIILIYNGWFNNRMIARGDWGARSPARMLDFLGPPSVWDEASAGGASVLYSGVGPARFPLLNLQANLHKIFGLGFEWTERLIWFFPYLIIATFSIYLLSKHLFKHTWAAFFATIYFISNNFIIFRLHGAQVCLAVPYALTPLCLYFFIRGIEEKKLTFALLNGLAIAAVVCNDLRIAILIILVQAAYGLYYSLVLAPDRSEALRAGVKNFAISGSLVFLFNIFWILPLAVGFKSSLLSPSDLSSLETVKSLSRTEFLDALALSIGANSKWNRFIYLDGQIITIALFPILLIIYGTSLLAKPRKDYLFWILAAFGFAFMAKGLNPPLSRLNFFFYNHVPLAAMYRLPSKFLLVGGTAISLCFGLGCVGILSKIKRSEWRLSAFLCLAFLPILVLLPALFGSKSLKTTAGGSSFRPFVPLAYFEFEEWLHQQESGYKSIHLPGGASYNFFSKAYPGYGPMTASQTNSSFGSYFKYRFRTVNGLQSSEDRVLPAMLRLLNVRYVFLAPSDYMGWDWLVRGVRPLYQEMLVRIDAFKKTEKEGIFVLEDSAPRFYLSRQLVHIDGDFEEVMGDLIDSGVDLQTITLMDKKPPEAVVSSEAGVFERLSRVEFEKLGNARYQIRIFDPPEGRFYLNFQDGYDSNWQIDGVIKSRLSAAGTNYFPLTNENGASSLEFTLKHRLQKYLDTGWKITQVSWIVAGGFLLVLLGRVTLRSLGEGGWRWKKRRF